jgi:hypothetical protein
MKHTDLGNKKIRKFLVLALAALVVTILSCNKFRTDTHNSPPETYTPVPGSVPFDISPLPSGSGQPAWRATYTSKGKTAKFGIHFGVSKDVTPKEAKDFPMKTGEGASGYRRV